VKNEDYLTLMKTMPKQVKQRLEGIKKRTTIAVTRKAKRKSRNEGVLFSLLLFFSI
jgi:hypothetical protein